MTGRVRHRWAAPYLDDGDVVLYAGDCVEVMRGLPEASVDAVVTDPPYELGFMGRSWDSAGVAFDPATWREALRVLKPGGHLLAFGGTRTSHRLACAIEDAGFEIRDCLVWLYGSGFPKSLDVSKAIDKAAGAEREVVGEYAVTREFRGRDLVGDASHATTVNITAPATPDAAAWQGWGTALKPGHEPIVMARKPLAERTVAGQVLATGTGALNVDGCRIGFASAADEAEAKGKNAHGEFAGNGARGTTNVYGGDDRPRETWSPPGRWPANVVLDEAAAALLDAEVGDGRARGNRTPTARNGGSWFGAEGAPGPVDAGDTGGPSRFYFVARDEEDGCPCPSDPASGAASSTSPPSVSGGSVPSGAATSEHRGTPTSSPGPSTNGTVSGLRPSAASVTPPTPSTAPASSPGSPADAPTLFPTPASGAAPSAPTGITTTTPSPPTSDGFAGPATSASTSPSAGRGAPASRAGEASADRRYTERGGTNFAPLPGERRPGVPSGRGAVGGRAFYTAKASGDEREGSKHPTVKPLALMRWLVRLVTPPGGVVLDPFTGSGTTLRAAREEGFRAIGIEREADYLADAAHRLRQLSLFGGLE